MAAALQTQCSLSQKRTSLSASNLHATRLQSAQAILNKHSKPEPVPRQRASAQVQIGRSSVAINAVGTAEPVADVELMELDLKVDGMTCQHCVARVADALKEQDFVESVAVSLDKGVATVSVRAENQLDAFAHLDALVETVSGLGFPAQPYFGEDDNDYGLSDE